jgi:hypothetical protein
MVFQPEREPSVLFIRLFFEKVTRYTAHLYLVGWLVFQYPEL